MLRDRIINDIKKKKRIFNMQSNLWHVLVIYCKYNLNNTQYDYTINYIHYLKAFIISLRKKNMHNRDHFFLILSRLRIKKFDISY